MRSVQLGPVQAVIADTLIIGIHFNIPPGAVLTYASIGPISIKAPRMATSITLYYTKDEAVTTYPYTLVPLGYSSRTIYRPLPVVWEGRHKIQSDYEHTLELTTYNLTGASVTVQGMCIYEVEEHD